MDFLGPSLDFMATLSQGHARGLSRRRPVVYTELTDTACAVATFMALP